MSISKYKEGSFRELLSIAFPLMLTSFSMMLMLFVDRLLLAHYSTAALNSAVNASTLGWAFLFGWMALANITEVFVAQYHGAKQLDRLGEPVWQMLWLAAASTFFFYPMATWGGEWIYGTSPETEMQRIYICWMMMFGPAFAAYGALSGFFVGQGKTKLITLTAIFANILNAILDVILIFGIPGLVPSLGIEGAAISTSIGSLFQMLVLLFVFLKKENRLHFGTDRFHFQPREFFQCFRIGAPGALFALVEVFGWALFYSMMTYVSQEHITIAGICQSLIIFLFFFGEGISKAATAIAGNLIGAKRIWFIPNLFKSGLCIHFFFLCGILGLFALFHEVFIDQFLPHATPEYIASIKDSLMTCLFISLLYVFFEGVRFLISGILTAAGDTTFLFIAGSLSIWVLMVIPVYVLVVQMHAPVEVAISVWLFFSICCAAIYYWRYRSDVWKTKSIITERFTDPLTVGD